jgi:hypothetical protein
VSDSAAIKEKLLASLRLAVHSSAIDVSANDAASLLAELSPVLNDERDAGAGETLDADAGTGARTGAGEGVPEGHHPNLSDDAATPIHSIPDIELPLKNGSHPHSKRGTTEEKNNSGDPPMAFLGPLLDDEKIAT